MLVCMYVLNCGLEGRGKEGGIGREGKGGRERAGGNGRQGMEGDCNVPCVSLNPPHTQYPHTPTRRSLPTYRLIDEAVLFSHWRDYDDVSGELLPGRWVCVCVCVEGGSCGSCGSCGSRVVATQETTHIGIASTPEVVWCSRTTRSVRARSLRARGTPCSTPTTWTEHVPIPHGPLCMCVPAALAASPPSQHAAGPRGRAASGRLHALPRAVEHAAGGAVRAATAG